MSGCLMHAPYWGPGLKPRHVPWLGIELVSDPLVRRLAVNPLSHTSQGSIAFSWNTSTGTKQSLFYEFELDMLLTPPAPTHRVFILTEHYLSFFNPLESL